MNEEDRDFRNGEAPSRLWATVLADLRVRLGNGEFADRFPTDRELCAHYGVSRHTAREAVRRLDVVDRRPRLGGRVRRPPGALENLGSTLRALGTHLALVETARGRRRSRPIAAALAASPTASLDVVVQVLLADGEPLLVSELWLAPARAVDPAVVGPLLGLRPGSDSFLVAEESVLPAVGSAEICAALNLSAGAAVFCVEQLIEDRDGPAGWHRVHVRPERYRCVVRWDPGAST
ncbi:MAG: GntR family transcriptional regulator [Actinomycetota bacterium]|nr:GntR family transcriptional regulator [Actinomycetota bacterium]